MRHGEVAQAADKMSYRHSVDVANDMLFLLKFTPYISQIILRTEGTFVKVGDEKKKAATVVNIDNHWNADMNWIQDKWIVVKLTARLIMNLRNK